MPILLHILNLLIFKQHRRRHQFSPQQLLLKQLELLISKVDLIALLFHSSGYGAFIFHLRVRLDVLEEFLFVATKFLQQFCGIILALIYLLPYLRGTFITDLAEGGPAPGLIHFGAVYAYGAAVECLEYLF